MRHIPVQLNNTRSQEDRTVDTLLGFILGVLLTATFLHIWFNF